MCLSCSLTSPRWITSKRGSLFIIVVGNYISSHFSKWSPSAANMAWKCGLKVWHTDCTKSTDMSIHCCPMEDFSESTLAWGLVQELVSMGPQIPLSRGGDLASMEAKSPKLGQNLSRFSFHHFFTTLALWLGAESYCQM